MQAFHETHDLIFQPVPVAHEYDLVLGEEEVLDSVEDLLTTLLNKVGGGLFLGVGFGFFFWFIVELASGGVAGWCLVGGGGVVLGYVHHHEPNIVDLVLDKVADGVAYLLDWEIGTNEDSGRVAANWAFEEI